METQPSTGYRALVVLSGGQDSTYCLFWARTIYGPKNVHAITFDYGQRHSREIQAAKDVAKLAGIASHEIVRVSDVLVSTSPLTDPDAPLEQYNSAEEMAIIIGSRVEKTFVPMRNAFFLTLAANRAVSLGCTVMVTGVCQEDNANYPDCRDTFIRHQQMTINYALGWEEVGKPYMFIKTPLMNLKKADAIKTCGAFKGLYAALAFTHTAYDGTFPPSGKDHATVLRAQAFEESGYPDPLILKAHRMVGFPLPETENYSPVKVAEGFRWIWTEMNEFAELTGILPITVGWYWWMPDPE